MTWSVTKPVKTCCYNIKCNREFLDEWSLENGNIAFRYRAVPSEPYYDPDDRASVKAKKIDTNTYKIYLEEDDYYTRANVAIGSPFLKDSNLDSISIEINDIEKGDLTFGCQYGGNLYFYSIFEAGQIDNFTIFRKPTLFIVGCNDAALPCKSHKFMKTKLVFVFCKNPESFSVYQNGERLAIVTKDMIRTGCLLQEMKFLEKFPDVYRQEGWFVAMEGDEDRVYASASLTIKREPNLAIPSLGQMCLLTLDNFSKDEKLRTSHILEFWRKQYNGFKNADIKDIHVWRAYNKPRIVFDKCYNF